MEWKYRIFLIGSLLACFLCWSRVFTVVDKVIEQPKHVETPEERARIEKRMQYHGLNGVVVLYLGRDGKYRFERGGQWCKL